MTAGSVVDVRDWARDRWTELAAILVEHAAAVTIVVFGAVTTTAAITARRRRVRRAWHTGARQVEVLAPADLDYAAAFAGAVRLWRDLTGLIHPPLRRFLDGQPHLGIDYTVTGDGITTRVWVPGGVPPGRVEAALRAAWPGCLLLPDPSPPAAAGRRRASEKRVSRTTTGGSIRPARVDTLPLRIPDPKTDSDPFRAWEALTAGLGRGERARIQILARPATGRRLRRYRRAVGRAHTGRTGSSSMLTGVLTAVLREVLDLVTGAHGTRPHPLSGYGIQPGRPNPQRTEELTAIRGKAAHPQWETAIRYTATTPGLDDRARDRARGIADAVFAPFALTAGLNSLTRRRLPHPARALAGRRLRRGALLSVPELAALAHLPSTTTALAGDTARRIPAPTQATNAASSRGNS